MKVMINISIVTKRHRGMGVFTKNILLHLLEDPSFEFILVSCCDIDSELLEKIQILNISYIQKNSSLPVFEQLIMPMLIKKHKPDICWFPSNTFPLYKPKNVQYIATIHDLIFLYKDINPKNITQKIGKIYRAIIIKYGIKRLDKITSVSLSALYEIIDTFSLTQKKATLEFVLYNSIQINDFYDYKILKKLNLIENQYVYTISGSAPSKNLMFLIESFAKYIQNTNKKDIKLVITGIINEQERLEFFTYADTLGVINNLIFTDFISEAEKNVLLKSCQLFIFASKYEGFGIPLIEALYFDAVVLASDIPVFREIGKDYVYYFNINNNTFLIDFFDQVDLKQTKSLSKVRNYINNTYNLTSTIAKLKKIMREKNI